MLFREASILQPPAEQRLRNGVLAGTLGPGAVALVKLARLAAEGVGDHAALLDEAAELIVLRAPIVVGGHDLGRLSKAIPPPQLRSLDGPGQDALGFGEQFSRQTLVDLLRRDGDGERYRMQPVERGLVVRSADHRLGVRVHPELVRFRKLDRVLVLAGGLDLAHALRDALELALREALALLGLRRHDEAR